MDPLHTLPPDQMLMQIVLSSQLSRVVAAAEELGIADHLLSGPMSVGTLAQLTGRHEDALYRSLRLLAAIGIFTEREPRTFANNEVSVLLSGDLRSFPRAIVRWVNCPVSVDTWQRFDYSLETGRPAFRELFGKGPFEYMAEHEDLAEIFNAAMTSTSDFVGKSIVAAYDFSSVTRVVDVGGGHGGLLRVIIEANPHLTGTAFDRPSVVKGATPQPGVLELEGGDFLQGVPRGADLYLMKHILHDWADEQCVRLLSNCRDAMRPDGKVIVVEHILSDTRESMPAKLLDLEMLVMYDGARERTAAQFQSLFAQAGLVETRTIRLFSSLCIIEACQAGR